MNMIARYTKNNEENAAAQVAMTIDGAQRRIQYLIKAEAAQGIAMLIHGVLQEHGM